MLVHEMSAEIYSGMLLCNCDNVKAEYARWNVPRCGATTNKCQRDEVMIQLWPCWLIMRLIGQEALWALNKGEPKRHVRHLLRDLKLLCVQLYPLHVLRVFIMKFSLVLPAACLYCCCLRLMIALLKRNLFFCVIATLPVLRGAKYRRRRRLPLRRSLTCAPQKF